MWTDVDNISSIQDRCSFASSVTEQHKQNTQMLEKADGGRKTWPQHLGVTQIFISSFFLYIECEFC